MTRAMTSRTEASSPKILWIKKGHPGLMNYQSGIFFGLSISIASADFVVVIYNPKSKKRDWQLNKARDIILEYRFGVTLVGVVTGAMRENQKITFTTLECLHKADVNMQSTVFIGNRTTTRYGDFLFTLRGYGQKYAL